MSGIADPGSGIGDRRSGSGSGSWELGSRQLLVAHRLPTVAPARTPGMTTFVGRPGGAGSPDSSRNCISGARALPERFAERAAQHLVHQRALEEPHFRLRRVDVHVHAIGRDAQEQVDFRAALLDRRDAVGLDDRVRDRPVLDDAAVDEDVLRAAGRSLIAERGDIPFDLQAAGLFSAPRRGPRARRTTGRTAPSGCSPACTAAGCVPRW